MWKLTREKTLPGGSKNKTIVLGYIDDSSSKIGKNLEGLPIYNASGEKLAGLLKDKGVTDFAVKYLTLIQMHLTKLNEIKD